MRTNILAKLGEVLEFNNGMRAVVSDLDAEGRGSDYYFQWVKLCPLNSVPGEPVLRSQRDYANSFEVQIRIDADGANIFGINVPEEIIPELEKHFLQHHRIPSLLRQCIPYQNRVQSQRHGVHDQLSAGWV